MRHLRRRFISGLLTRQDHEFLGDAGVRAEAFHCLRFTGTPRAWFKSIAEATSILGMPGVSKRFDHSRIDKLLYEHKGKFGNPRYAVSAISCHECGSRSPNWETA